MTLDDLPTPCLVLDRTILNRNIRVMASAVKRLSVPLRPHMKTAKSIDVARLALQGQPGGITVSTLAEAEYFAAHGIGDILYLTSVVRELARLFKDCALFVLHENGKVAEVLKANPYVAGTIWLEGTTLQSFVRTCHSLDIFAF